MKVIGFVGPKGAGKDEAFTLLKSDKKVLQKLSFAGPLKQICQQVFSLTPYQVNDPVGKERLFPTPITMTLKHIREIKKLLTEWVDPIDPVTEKIRYNSNAISVSGLENRVFKSPRELLQFVGTEFIRDRVWTEWHVTAALSDKAIQALPDASAMYAITDVRFENELDALQKKFGTAFVCYYVERPEAEERLATATHPSETLVKKLREKLGEKYVLVNDGTIDDFKKTLKSVKAPLEHYKVPKKSRFLFGERR